MQIQYKYDTKMSIWRKSTKYMYASLPHLQIANYGNKSKKAKVEPQEPEAENKEERQQGGEEDTKKD